jgi:NAD(P)-dependent dehydrogenase (short-subunit alcohol dehydrogenase family)
MGVMGDASRTSTILVTGSTDGIGLATAQRLFISGHKILVHGRNEEKARAAVQKIQIYAAVKEKASSPKLIPVWGDLSVMKEVVALAHQVQGLAPDLNVLLNNAGVYMKQKRLSSDHFEMTFCVNHLAPHLLTHHLLPLLKAQPAARVVTVASVAHQRGHLHLDNLNSEKHFESYEAYSTSKLCNILFTRCLAALLKNSSHVTANCLHPGVIETKLLKAGFNIHGDGVDKGCETSVFLATDPSVEKITGGYFVNSVAAIPSRLAQDDNLAVSLWKKTEEILKPWL